MSKSNLPWLRLYTEIIDDEKIRLLAFEDRWHYVAILCMKGRGLLDTGDSHELMMRKVSVKMGLAIREVEEVARRLSEVGLIEQKTLQPCKWDERQFKSDSSTARVNKFRERKKNQAVTDKKRACNVSVTVQDTDTDKEIEAKASLSSGKPNNSVAKKIFEAYNQELGDVLPKAQILTDARKRAIAARVKELTGTTGPNGSPRFNTADESPEWFARLFRKVKLNPHWIGENDRGWRADLDWLMTPKNFVKVLEYIPASKQ